MLGRIPLQTPPASTVLPPPPTNAAILFEPDAYVLAGKVMGRQSAGNGFLRAAVAGRDGERLWAYTPRRASSEAFVAEVKRMDPTADCGWLPPHRFDLMEARGALYLPGPMLGAAARLRLRAGMARYSLCAVTHTLASDRAMAEIADLLTAPVAPWDAMICTSSVALDTVRTVTEAQGDYLSWRLGGAVKPRLPQFPVIPLGVHCSDFAFDAKDRRTARADLGLKPDEVVALFAGRMSPNGKAHPIAMYQALQEVARRTGKPMALIQAGQFFNAQAEALYRDAARVFCPDVRCLFVGGQDARRYRACWAGADLFVSLSDSIQETFGLTPVEAMASGLPVVVTDWNGYKDTVRDGLDGFRIRTWAPEAGAGADIARDYESGAIDFDLFLSRCSTTVTADLTEVVDRLSALAADPELRRRMGASGQARARADFDWSVIYRRYQDLWAELSAMRGDTERSAASLAWAAEAPPEAPAHMDPFASFATYPSAAIGAATFVALTPGAGPELYGRLTAQPLLAPWKPAPVVMDRIFAALAQGETTIARLAEQLGLGAPDLIVIVARLAKMDLVRLRQAGEAPGEA